MSYTLVLFYLLFSFIKQRAVKEFSDGNLKTVFWLFWLSILYMVNGETPEIFAMAYYYSNCKSICLKKSGSRNDYLR